MKFNKTKQITAADVPPMQPQMMFSGHPSQYSCMKCVRLGSFGVRAVAIIDGQPYCQAHALQRWARGTK